MNYFARQLSTGLILLSTLSTTWAVSNPATVQALADLDNSFVQTYNSWNKATGDAARPILMVSDFSYQLIRSDGTTETFNGLLSPFNELKAVSHIGPYLFSVGKLHWVHPQDDSWKQELTSVQTKVHALSTQMGQIDWSNPAWPGREKEIEQFMQNALQIVDRFITSLLVKGSYTQEDYTSFVNQYIHIMIATMYLSNVGNTVPTLRQLYSWKSQLGKAWDQLYVVIVGTKGRSTSELTLDTSTAAYTIASTMNPAAVKDHIIIAPMVQSTPQALAVLGAIINTRTLAQSTFITERAKKATGLYEAALSSTIPLAMTNVKQIVANFNNNKINIPYLGLSPQSEPNKKRSDTKQPSIPSFHSP